MKEKTLLEKAEGLHVHSRQEKKDWSEYNLDELTELVKKYVEGDISVRQASSAVEKDEVKSKSGNWTHHLGGSLIKYLYAQGKIKIE